MGFDKGNKLGKGNKGAKLIEEALRRAATQENGERIRAGVEKLLDKFAEGDLAAFSIVADRIDGRPNQSVDMSITKDVREYSTEELIERIAEIRGSITAGVAGKEESTGGPSGLH